jgi:hypothetical protein
MKGSAWFIVGFVLVSCGTKSDYKPSTWLTVAEQDQLMMTVIRYVGKPPENVGPEEKFDATYNDYYQQLVGRHRLDKYYVDDEGNQFFLISRDAPSLFGKRVAIGGKMRRSESGVLTEYEEVYRTWKMKEDELSRKGAILFEAMVKQLPLDQYQKPVSTEEFIEFPDPRTYYDKSTRSWKVRDSIR